MNEKLAKGLPELNPDNYTHEEVVALNDWAVRASALLSREGAVAGYRCYHCRQVFDRDAAEFHFGKTPDALAKCVEALGPVSVDHLRIIQLQSSALKCARPDDCAGEPSEVCPYCEAFEAGRSYGRGCSHPAPVSAPTAEAAKEYAKRNPLGGPAAALEMCAARIRNGENYYEALADFGLYAHPTPSPDAPEREEAAKYMDAAKVLCSNPRTAAHYNLAARALRQPQVTEELDREWLSAALLLLIDRIEACGASVPLTTAVTTASDIHSVVANKWDPVNARARITAAINGKGEK